MNTIDQSYSEAPSPKQFLQCPHFKVCSGCEKESPISPPSPLYIQASKFVHLVSSGEKKLPLTYGDMTRWRTRARLACRLVRGEISFGLYFKGSHNLVAIPHCQVHHSAINTSIRLLEKKLAELQNSRSLVYDEARHSGLLRYLQCTVERRTGRVQVAFIVNASDSEARGEKEHRLLGNLISLAKELYDEDPALWHSFWLNANSAKTNVIMGNTWRHVVGQEYVWETLCGREIPFLPSHFEQANLPIFEMMLSDIKNHTLTRTDTLVELYAGMGVIGLCMRDAYTSTIAVERSSSSEQSFQKAFRRLPQALQENTKFIEGDSEEVYTNTILPSAQYRNHILLVDPPRKGLSQSLVNLLVERSHMDDSPRKLIYISCHYPSLERDAVALMQKGKWTLESAKSYVFFPGTDHIETVFVFSR